MNKIWFGPTDLSKFNEVIEKNVTLETFRFILDQVDIRFEDHELYNLLDTAQETPTEAEIKLVLSVATEDLGETDDIPVGLTIITRPFKLATLDNTPIITNTTPVFADNTGDTQNWVLNTAITPLVVPIAAGVPTPTYAVVGNLRAGISFDPNTRILSGSPT